MLPGYSKSFKLAVFKKTNLAALQVFKSSAGSGKTFTLVQYYLQLVLKEPSSYRQILAVTFTNKATWEMKERILATLKSLANGEASTMRSVLEDYFQSQGAVVNITDQAKTVLTYILHDYSRFSVSTIDSFFNQVVRSFSRELGLSVNFEVEIDQQGVLKEVTDRLMLEIGKDEQLTKWLREFAFDKMEDDRDWNIQRDIEGLGRELFNEQFQQIRDQIYREQEDLRSYLGEFIKHIDQIAFQYKNKLKSYAKEVLELTESYGLEPTDFAKKQSSLIVNFQKLFNQNDLEQANKFLGKFKKIEDPSQLASKHSEKRQLIIQCAEEGLFDLLSYIAEFIENEHAKYASVKAIKSHIYAFGILADLEKHLKNYRQENELLLIPDLNNLLKQITAKTDSPFIYEKVGHRFSHFLLDEFQDTSNFQWDNLRPLLINSLSDEKENLIVGDVKQSIYRWRSGNPNMLINRVYDDLASFQGLIKNQNLAVNYRSLGHVVSFNNAFFREVPEVIKENELLANSGFLEKAYQGVEQDILPDNVDQGFVQVYLFSKRDEQNFSEIAQEHLIDSLNAFFERGYNYRDIAILVRTNAQAKVTAQLLSSEDNKLPVISSDSLMVSYSTKVQLLVHLCYYLNDPSSNLVKTYLLNDYLRYFQKAQVNNDQIFKGWQDKDYLTTILPGDFFAEWGNLKKLPLYELGESLIRIFHLNDSNDAYLQRFLDMLLDFTGRAHADLNHFLEWWEEQGKKEAVQVPAGEDAIRLETIHKAKGLEYPVVVLPFTDWSLGGGGGNLIWVEPAEEPFNQFPYLPVTYQSGLNETLFKDTYQEELMLSFLDNTNLLYVSFTRAIKELYVYAPDPRDKQGNVKMNKVNGLIYEVLMRNMDGNLSTFQDEDGIRFEVGHLADGKGDKSDSLRVETMSKLPSNPWRSKLTFRAHSNEVIDTSKSEISENLNRGLLIHGVLANIRVLDDLDESINQYYFEGLVGDHELASLKEDLKEILNIPKVQEWFDDNWHIHNEEEILTPDGTVYRPDRVITFGKKAKVIDYKTGKPDDKDENQIKRYGRSLKDMGYEDVEQILLYIDSKQIHQVEK